MPRPLLGIVVLTMCFPAVPAQHASADFAAKPLQIPRVSQPPVIDGRLDPGEWAQAAVIDDFHQVEPVEFATPSERTRVYVMYDADALYVAARMHDSEPDRVAAGILRQGESLGDDDNFAVVLDTFNDRRSGYWFEVNPNGVRRQAIFQNTSERNFDWKGIWHATGRRDAEGWSVEMLIPVKTLSFDPAGDAWGVNFRRKIARRAESMAAASRNQQVNPSTTRPIHGLAGLDQGRGLDVVPAISVRNDRRFAPGSDATQVQPSLDIHYNITPALGAALTINTDFSATEVDDRQVNLTRFGVFFPEKRAFFLQGADIFEFGRLSGSDVESAFSASSLHNGRPFFSRRIGLSASSQPVDLRAGGKLTGRMGRWNLGLLDVQQAAYDAVASRNLLVGRAVANVLEESSVGVVFTNGDPRSNVSNTVVGADFRYLNTRVAGNNSVAGEAWYQRSNTGNLAGRDAAWGVRLSLPNQTGLFGSVGTKRLEANFNPALGFVNNTGIRDDTAELRYTWSRDGFIQTVFSAAGGRRVEWLDGGLQTAELVWQPLAIETSSGEELEFEYLSTKEVLHEDFEIFTGVILPPGEYSFAEQAVGLETGGHRRLSGGLRISQGDFYGGERRSAEAELQWRPSPHFAVQGEYEFNDVDLPQGDFIFRLLRLRIDVVFSAELSWSNLVQYDNESEAAGINSRLQWIPQAGRETYLAMNHALQDRGRNDGFESRAADLVLKLGYTLRF